jgi:hypothetical protein
MSSTIGNLVDRVFREYLEPNDDIQSFTNLRTAITDTTTTTVAYESDFLTTEEEDAMGSGAFIEINQELMLVLSLNTADETLSVKRGARGTTATTHAETDLIKINPPFIRLNVFNAVKDQIENLYPTLFAVETQTITTANGYVALTGDDDSRIVAPLKAVSQYQSLSSGNETTVQFRGVSIELIDVPTSITGTGKVVQFFGIQTGVDVHCTFKKKFGEISNEDDTLSNIGLETEYEPIIMAGVAAQMIAGKDIPAATTEYISDSIQASVYPVGSSSSIRNSLLQYQQILIQQARKDLRARYPEPVSLNSVVYPSA